MQKIEDKIAYTFKDKELLKIALTHSSHYGNKVNNERLEYLGDAVLELVISEYLFKLADLSEGKMTKIRANIVCAESLSMAASALDLGSYILLGKGEIVTGGRSRKSNLANAFEAVLGAVFLDSDYETARRVVLSILKHNIGLALEGKLVNDYKTALQEEVQKDTESRIEYRLKSEEGPEHDKTFYVELYINDVKGGSGSGKSKKEAEQEAAKDCILNHLDI